MIAPALSAQPVQAQRLMYFHPVLIDPTSAESTNTLTFEYCIVRLARQWWSGNLLAEPGWYLQGMHHGDYAGGPIAVSATGTGAGSGETLETGSMPYVPTAFIAVKNLVTDTTNLGLDSVQARNATSFGPFSLMHATSSSGTLSSPGIQIIGWICTAQPQLPPATDPTLIDLTPSGSGEVITDITDIAKTLAGLFGTG